jgi:serine kinase of HPr protein (carbohydrate metabolism regulator)
LNKLSSERIHASCVAIGGIAVLIAGRSGTGKSDLALRLIDRGAKLVSDDYTLLVREGTALIASPPETIRGKIEMRGVGIEIRPHLKSAKVALMITLDDPPIRLPTFDEFREIAGVKLPVIALAGLEASAPIKVEAALARVLLK